MTKIKSLTDAQWATIYEQREIWLQRGLTTDPAPRADVELAINAIRVFAGQQARPTLWFDGPATAIVFQNLWANLRDNLGDNLRDNIWDNLRDNLRDNLGDNLRDNIWDNLRDNLWANIWDNLRDNLKDNLRDNLWANIWDNLRDNLRDNLGDNLRDNLGDNLWANLWDNLRDNLRDNIWDNLRDNLWANIWANIWDNLWRNLGDNLWANLGATWSVPPCFYGSSELSWIAHYVIAHENIKPMHTTEQMTQLRQWAITAQAGWWFPCKNINIICEPPSAIHREDGRLHCETGPAVTFRDGWKHWSIRGVTVDEQIVMQPDMQTTLQISQEENAEVKRIRIERYGWQRYLTDTNAIVVHSRRNDVDGTRESLMKCDGMRVLVGACPSTGRVYAMEVAREVETCEQAQGWLRNSSSGFCLGAS